MGVVGIGALAAISLGIAKALDFRGKSLPIKRDPEAKPPHGNSHRQGKYAYSPKGQSGQDPDLSRLIRDRSSSIRKINRWTRAGKLMPPEATERAANRHKVRRVEAQRALNAERLRKQG